MEEQTNSFKQKALLIGAIGGAVVGLLAAQMYVRSAEQEAAERGEPVSITPAKGLQIGVLVMGLLRQLSNL